MKVALLLSGLPRKVREGFTHNWSRLLAAYDVDVYIHMWKDQDYGSVWPEVYEVYNPYDDCVKSIQLQAPFKFTSYKQGIELPHADKSRPLPQYDVMSCFRQLPMFYSWQRVYRTCYESRINYDCVIRSRFDLAFYNSIDLHTLDLTKLNHGPGGHVEETGRSFDDNLCITNQANAEKLFLNIFDNVIQHARDVKYLQNAEHTWTSMIRQSSLDAVAQDSLRFQVLREDMLWWGE